MKSMIEIVVNYGPNALAAIIALIYLIKDWESFKTRYMRMAALLIIILLCIVGVSSTFSTNKNNDEHRAEDKIQIRALQKSMSTSIKINRDNTRQFSDTYGELYQKVSDLESNVKTVGLREEADKLKAELVSTQKALNPAKAAIDFTFDTPNNGDLQVLRTVTLPVNNDVVHVEFSMINLSNVKASNAEIGIRICYACEYASEPKDFIKISGQVGKLQRNKSFERILPRSKTPTMSVDIKVPPQANSIEFVVFGGCDNCATETQVGVIKLSR